MRCTLPELLLFGVLLTPLLMFVGCAKEVKHKPLPKNESTDIKNTDPPDQKQKVIPVVEGDGADAAVQRVINGLQSNNPAVLWEALPASYQQDVNDLVHQYATRMDDEIWKETFATMQKAVRVIQKQKTYYLAQSIARHGPAEKDRLEKEFDHLMQLFSILTKSDIADIQRLRTVDVGVIIKSIGGDSMQQFELLSEMAVTTTNKRLPKIKISQMQVQLVSTNGEHAIVLISSPVKEARKLKQEEVAFVKVEGKWIPEELASNWKNDIAKAKTGLKRMTPEVIAGAKPRLLNVIKQVNSGLDEMDNAQSAKAFSVATSKTIAPLFGLAMNPPDLQPKAKSPEPKKTGKGKTVTINIQGNLTQPQIEKLEEQLLLMESETELTLSSQQSEPGVMLLQVSPIYDISVFAKNDSLWNRDKS